MQVADLVISKDEGTFDTLSEEATLRGKASYLVQTKCHPYCTIHQLPLGALILHNA